MADATCSVAGCERIAANPRGWCSTHYSRWRLHGNVGADVPVRVQRRDYWEQVDNSAGPARCWPWRGRRNGYGYGHFYRDGRMSMAHRLAYEELVGPIPDGLELDHLCHTNDAACRGGVECPHRRCCNPAHLQPVTTAENIRRGRHAESAVTHCPAGHPYDEANTYRARGQRQCRLCRREASRLSILRRRASE